jgi:hypothetical protein
VSAAAPTAAPQPNAWRAIARYLLGVLAGFVLTAAAAQHFAAGCGLTLLDPLRGEEQPLRLLAYLRRPLTEDVLIVGSSRVGGGLDAEPLQTRLRGATGEQLSVYKLDLPGLRPALLAQVLEQAVLPRPPRRLLVLGIETRYFCRPVPVAAGETPVGEVAGEWQVDDERAASRLPLDGLRALWTLPWTLLPQVRAESAAIARRLGEYRGPQEKREHLERRQRQASRAADNFVLPPGYQWAWTAPDGPDARGFERVLELLDRLPCPVLFVRMPLVEGFDQRHMAEVYGRFRGEVVPQLLARGHRYEDLNRPPFPRDRSAFYSLTHLAANGAEQTTRHLVDEVLAPWFAAQR